MFCIGQAQARGVSPVENCILFHTILRDSLLLLRRDDSHPYPVTRGLKHALCQITLTYRHDSVLRLRHPSCLSPKLVTSILPPMCYSFLPLPDAATTSDDPSNRGSVGMGVVRYRMLPFAEVLGRVPPTALHSVAR